MDIIFFGSGKFAVPVLETLLASPHRVRLVVTQPDRPRGRTLRIGATPVKTASLKNHLDIFQPENPNADESLARLKKMEADIFLVVSYGKILSKEILRLPRHLCVNIHGSLLPRYRGSSPIHRALIHGETTTGITFIRMNERMDAGEMMLQKSVAVEAADNAVTLEEKLSRLAAEATPGVLALIESGRVVYLAQDESKATYAPRLEKSDGLIDWNATPQAIFNLFRGCAPWPGIFTYLDGKRIKILEMGVAGTHAAGAGGEITAVSEKGMEVACRGGSILIKEVLPESQGRISAKDFLRGRRLEPGDRFDI